jgi:mono/diheme cytochrome c family protein
VALVIVIVAQSIGGSDEGQSVAPVENGGAGRAPVETVGIPVPQQGNAKAGEVVFRKSGCGDCHALAAANAKGTIGPSLDEDQVDFTTVVGCVTTGPGDMPSFRGRLTAAEIRNVAKFVAVTVQR